ncbi:CxxC motif protein [Halobacterium phage phiH]|jgi:DNA-directed RNA polymerase subunit RPC12/RpoP|uniref:CxxC motif protein n=1 Tax=Halobacterium phage phiH TaxID=169684 RepID=A0A3G1ZKR6_BPPHH|nr:CxxC motif protein [Halobacterium phage phiH]AYM00271.1 CxxC motif protein [Halobacterium phage phiH]
MNAWDSSTIACTDCDGEAVAKSNQWGKTTHYECPDCGCRIDAEDVR